jgi:hypothetical protein
MVLDAHLCLHILCIWQSTSRCKNNAFEPWGLSEGEANAFQTTLDLVYGVGWECNKLTPSPTLLQDFDLNREQAMDVTSKEEEDLELNVLLLMSGEPAAVGLEEQLRDEMKSNEMTDEVLKSYLEK